MVQILGNALKPQIFASKTVKRQMLKLLRFFQWGYIHKLILLALTKYGLIILKLKMTLTSAVL